MSRHIAKLFKAPLVLASVALALHIGAATAVDSKGDIQQQMRELLTGTTPTHFIPQSGPRDAEVTPGAVDSQKFVKQLLLGTAAYRVEGPETIKRAEVSRASGKTEPQKHAVAYGDMQASVRDALLGQPHASDAARYAARPTR
jgi:hypothetical protein